MVAGKYVDFIPPRKDGKIWRINEIKNEKKVACLTMGYTPAIPIFNGNMLIKHWILGKPIFNQTQIIEPELLSDENG
jgi:hypothetical protein